MAEQPYGNVPLFRELTAEDMGDLEATEIESLCFNCQEQGMTRLLLTKIPFFREIVVMSFSCSHCGHSNNDIQPAGRIQQKGCRISVQIKTRKDFNRQVVKADTASLRIPELEFEVPCGSQKGSFTTVEGVISRAIEGLEQEQPIRKAMYPEVAAQIDEFITKLKNLEPPFHLILDDPAGNSFIENPNAPETDPDMTINMYVRTRDQNKGLGLAVEEETDAVHEEEEAEGEGQGEGEEPAEASDSSEPTNVTDEVLEFAVTCSNCNMPTKSRMKLVKIPYFKEVILMASNCDSCGYKDSEVKSGAGIEPKGRRITLKMTDSAMDLNRDVLKSDTSRFLIPDLNFELMMGTLGGKFTTLEGLLTDVRNQLMRPYSMVQGQDSAPQGSGTKLKEFIDKIDEIISGDLLVSVVLDDPAGNCYIQNVYAPDKDPELTVEEYERSEEQNDDLGILNMKTENYREDEAS
ncbi:zinc finger protein ZPR1-like [Patiria miniata]|uniref:Zinc finger ZPR1-type domain-containing protein n=1 Tax=Patiria miniata TaxID=46514 RepID=A0A914AP51_PATMI|nr:zinc finger protein ZPR1-like [Patiria miniata]